MRVVMARRSRPVGVSSARRLRRWNSSTPYSASSAAIWAVSVGWLIPICTAAAVNPPAWATAWNDRRLVYRIDNFY